MEFELTQEERQLFLEETDENLQTLEEGFLALERCADDPELLNRIFRAAHTIKGSAATAGQQRMADLTHAMENVLDLLRKGTLAVTPALLDTLLAGLDALRAFREAFATGQDADVDEQTLLKQFALFAQGEFALGTAQETDGWPDTPLTALESAQIDSGLSEGLQVLDVRVRIAPESIMPSVRAFQLLWELGERGTVVRSWPSQDEVEAEQVGDRIRVLVLLPPAEQEQIRTIVTSITDLHLVSCEPYVPKGTPSTPSASVPMIESEANAPAPKESAAAAGASASPRTGRTVRVDVDLLDKLMHLVGELVMDRSRLLEVAGRASSGQADSAIAEMLASISMHLERTTNELQDVIQRTRMQPVEVQFKKFPRLVRDVAQKAGKEVNFIIRGEKTELDRAVIEEIGDPLMHALRNAIDHGLEPPEERERLGKPRTGTVILEAMHQDNAIIISIRDDGRGIDPDKIRASAVKKGLLTTEDAARLSDDEALRLIWAPGFSTAEKVSEVSGRGVGLDVVRQNIERLNGTIEVLTEKGNGTEFRIRLPLTLLIMRVLHVAVGPNRFCIPLFAITDVDHLETDAIHWTGGQEVVVRREQVIPLIRLAEFFRIGAEPPARPYVVHATGHNQPIGIVVDRLIGEGEVVIQPLGGHIGDITGLSGSTLLGDGTVALILDVGALVKHGFPQRTPH